MPLPVRKLLPHTVPQWVPEGSSFFLTLNCQTRGRNQLCQAGLGERVLAAPAPVVLTAPALTAGQFTFTVNGVSGAGYIVQVSTNPVNWTPVLTNAAPFTFSTPRNPRVSRCFYRALAQ
jgi:hypothetical protein